MRKNYPYDKDRYIYEMYSPVNSNEINRIFEDNDGEFWKEIEDLTKKSIHVEPLSSEKITPSE